MKKFFNLKTILLLTIIILFSTNIMGSGVKSVASLPEASLLYDDVWSTLYNPAKSQCDATPTITGNGSHINPRIASKLRWIAISQDLLYSPYRARLINNPKDIRFKGKLAYGDTIWIDSPYDKLNGWWVVKDAKNKMYKKSIDFLQSSGDKNLYDNNKLWSGKWNNVNIYKVSKYNYFSMKVFLNKQLTNKNYLAVKLTPNIKIINKTNIDKKQLIAQKNISYLFENDNASNIFEKSDGLYKREELLTLKE